MLSTLEQFQYGLLGSQTFMASSTTSRLLDLDLSRRRTVESFHSASVQSLDIEKVDCRYLLSGAANGALCIHDLWNTSGKMNFTAKIISKINRASRFAHSYSVDTVQWYPFDTGLFTSSSMDCNLRIWDTNCMKPVETFNLLKRVSSHDMSPISTQHCLIAVASAQSEVVLIDPKSGSNCHALRGHKTEVICVKWSPLAEFLLASGGSDNKLFLWDIRSAKGYLRVLDQHNGEAFSSRKDVITAHNGIVNGLQFTDDGLYLVSYGSDSHLRLWDVASGKNTLVNYGRVTNENRRKFSFDLSYNSGVKMVFVPSGNRVQVYDLLTGFRMKTLVGHFKAANCCSFRPTVQELYSGGNDCNILLWSPDVEREIEEEMGSDEENQHASSDAWSSDND